MEGVISIDHLVFKITLWSFPFGKGIQDGWKKLLQKFNLDPAGQAYQAGLENHVHTGHMCPATLQFWQPLLAGWKLSQSVSKKKQGKNCELFLMCIYRN